MSGESGSVARVRAAATAVARARAEVTARMAPLGELGLGGFLDQGRRRPLGEMRRTLHALGEAAPSLGRYLEFARAREACLADGLAAPIVRAFDKTGGSFADLEAALDWCVARGVVRAREAGERDVFQRTCTELDRLRGDFAKHDREELGLAAGELRVRLAKRSPTPGSNHGPKKDWTDGALLGHEFSKAKRHLPLRRILGQAMGAIQELTPCLMMSPLTVAQYLPGRELFDVIIMDEASQIRPEHALGALLRGRKAVIVGDPQQLPPTNFFERSIDEAEEEEEGEGEETERAAPLSAEDRISAAAVLDLAIASYRPVRRLLWHYRSRHESLIAFSNREFYDDKLIIFPSPNERSETLGVRFERVDGVYHDRCNPREAEAVVAAALRCMGAQPERSIGIVAMNAQQRDMIEAELDRARAGSSAEAELLEAYEEKMRKRGEPLFVKNLENVQGDERDAILISLGWGRNAQGVFHQRFFVGGLAEYGPRRMNVALTRAKFLLRVFASFDPEEIRIDEKTARGTRLLREYLTYARDGRLGPAGDGEGEAAESPFEE
ncbi:MAG: DEAD/DEAH box helicase, partial [Acetobacteraceae bacterium]